jgi:Flp pilus assembly protein TadG
MRTAVSTARRRRSRGGTLVEFTMVVFLLIIVLLSVVEMGRMVLVYTTVTNSARAAARYAIVHGASRTPGMGKDGPSGPSANPAEVVQVVKDFASTGLLDVNSLTINVTYPAGINTVGSTVNVAVSYTYNPFIGMLPLRVPLSNVSRGVIVF